MVGETAIRLTELGDDLGPEAAQNLHAEFATGAIATVDNNPQRPCEVHTRSNGLDIGGDDVVVAPDAPAFDELATLEYLPELLDFRPVDGRGADNDLEAVVLRRIVAGGNHDPGLPSELLDGEIKNGRRNHADACNVDTGCEKAFHQRIMVGPRTMAAVIADHRRINALLPEERATGSSETFDPFNIEIHIYKTTDVVRPEHL